MLWHLAARARAFFCFGCGRIFVFFYRVFTDFLNANENTAVAPAGQPQSYKDAEYLLRFPMTKAGIRAIDTLEAFIPTVNGGHNTTGFIVAGASKRGWTTWTVGAVDAARPAQFGKPRVVAIAPLVLDILKFQASIKTMYRKYGGWSFALADYYNMSIMGRVDSPATTLMSELVDPYFYRERYANVPKLVVISGGDEFLMPDDTHFYWPEMQGEKHLLMLQNAEHTLATGVLELVPAMQGFLAHVATGAPKPQLTWTRTHTGGWGNATDTATITAWTNVKPHKVLMHHAKTLNGKARDFRLITGIPPGGCHTVKVDGEGCVHPVLWLEKAPTFLHGNATTGYTYSATMKNPPKWEGGGWHAFFLEFRFEGPMDTMVHFTTEVAITPQTYPFPDCKGKECDHVPLV